MQTIDTARLGHPAVANYLQNADRRTKAGARFALEALGISFPDYLNRKPAGRPAIRAVMDAYRSDNPETLHEATMRKSREAAAKLSSRVASSFTA
jgi:hypothetical protein